jgi:hypothetical protein
MAEALPIIAKCTKCGRGFVSLPEKSMIDHYPNKRKVTGEWGRACGGRIELIPLTQENEG